MSTKSIKKNSEGDNKSLKKQISHVEQKIDYAKKIIKELKDEHDELFERLTKIEKKLLSWENDKRNYKAKLKDLRIILERMEKSDVFDEEFIT